jgi:hypothetical protein
MDGSYAPVVESVRLKSKNLKEDHIAKTHPK